MGGLGLRFPSTHLAHLGGMGWAEPTEAAKVGVMEELKVRRGDL